MGADDFERHLERALHSRPVIEQAKGVLAALRTATPDQAFAELLCASQNHNVKVSELAVALVAAAAGCEVGDPRLRHVVWLEWGRGLDARRQPTDARPPRPVPAPGTPASTAG